MGAGNSVAKGDNYFVTAQEHESRGDYVKSLTFYKKAAETRKKTLGKHLKTAEAYTSLGLVYKNLKKFDLALDCLKKASDITLFIQGPDHVDISNCYYNVGNVYLAEKKFDLSIEFYTKALESRKVSVGHDDQRVADIYNNIGIAHVRQGSLTEAIDNYKSALNICVNILGPIHVDVADTYNNMATAYSLKKEYNQAISTLLKAQEIYQEIGKKDKIITIYYNLGLTFKAQGNMPAAIENFTNCVEMLRRETNPDYKKMGDCFNNLGICYTVFGDLEGALEMHKLAMHAQQNWFPEQHSLVLQTKRYLGSVEESLNLTAP